MGREQSHLPGLHVAFTIAYHLPPISHHLFPILWYNPINIKNACMSRLATGQETAAVPSDPKVWMCERMLSKQGFCFLFVFKRFTLPQAQAFPGIRRTGENDQG